MMTKLAVPYDLLNVKAKAQGSTFNKEKGLGGVFSVIVKHLRIFV